jgi:CRP-like cAMP-binding protein
MDIAVHPGTSAGSLTSAHGRSNAMSTIPALGLLTRKLNKHVPLSKRDTEALLNLPHTLRDLRAEAYIVREGEPPGPCAILISGFAFRQKVDSNGARQILSVQIPGEALDMQHLFLDCADHSVQALTNVSVAMVPRPALREIAMQRPNVAHAFAVSQQIEASIAREWLLNVGRRDARRAVADLICEVAVRLEGQDLISDYGYELPMSQEQLGDATGLTSIHINRTLRALENDGLITRSRRSIRFPDWLALKRAADFNSLYLHLGQQAAAV